MKAKCFLVLYSVLLILEILMYFLFNTKVDAIKEKMFVVVVAFKMKAQ